MMKIGKFFSKKSSSTLTLHLIIFYLKNNKKIPEVIDFFKKNAFILTLSKV